MFECRNHQVVGISLMEKVDHKKSDITKGEKKKLKESGFEAIRGVPSQFQTANQWEHTGIPKVVPSLVPRH